ncbi:type III secretion system chaperone [Pseudovibrio denitrificans]|uniref:type III secretion system chaperone n=1 Tax=Pseudovibrio denitrificans TaxID=258256 RepID=UPI0039BFBAFE
MHSADRVTAVISQTLGLPELAFDGSGHAELVFEGSFSGFLSRVDDSNLEFSFYLPDLNLSDPSILTAMLMANCRGNATGSGRLAIDEDSMQALYCERWSVADVQDHKVPERLIDLVSTAAFWLAEGTHSVLQSTSAKALTAAS